MYRCTSGATIAGGENMPNGARKFDPASIPGMNRPKRTPCPWHSARSTITWFAVPACTAEAACWSAAHEPVPCPPQTSEAKRSAGSPSAACSSAGSLRSSA